jgi:octaprenyl-diphosphate synthase
MTQLALNSRKDTTLSIEEILSLIRDELLDVEEEFTRQISSNVQVVDHIGKYLQTGGGKRIRPILLLLTAKLFNRPITPAIIHIATVVEFIHTATLVHDDIIDGAEIRRGRPSVNQLWGNQITVLMGDWLYMYAFEMTLRERSFEVLEILTTITRKMTEGELIQLSHIGNIQLTVDEYFDIIQRKTAYLFSACTEIGGLLGGASREQQAALREFGMNLGTAFQLTDDVLDFISTESVLGKPAGNDLREGKLTLPLIYLVENGRPEYIEMIRTVIHDQAYRHVDRAGFVRVLEEEGVLEQARMKAREYAARAQTNLETLPESIYRQALADVTWFSVERSK